MMLIDLLGLLGLVTGSWSMLGREGSMVHTKFMAWMDLTTQGGMGVLLVRTVQITRLRTLQNAGIHIGTWT